MEMMFRYAEVQLANSDKRVLLPMTFARIKKDGTHVQAILGQLECWSLSLTQVRGLEWAQMKYMRALLGISPTR
jgi:hypothetical protein